MSLKERLEAKKPRREVVPVQVSDPTEDRQTLTGAFGALQVAQAREDAQPKEIEKLSSVVEEAAAAVRAHYVEVELEQLPADTWELVMARWSGDSIDWAAALAPLLAESCVDPELRDQDWWAQRLADPAWSEGDRDALRASLLRLNVSAADAIVPKG